MRFDYITILHRMYDALLAEVVSALGIKQGLLDIRVHDLRDYTTDKHRSTDDEAYGGGPGMVMLAEPVLRCVEAIQADGWRLTADGNPSIVSRQPSAVSPHLIMTSPQG